MIVFRAMPYLAVVATVLLVWRVAVWRRTPGDPVREAVVWLLIAISLAVVAVTLFPLYVIFYDWQPRFSLVPLVSTLELLREAHPRVALRNIGGNLLLLLPIGFLLPALFERARGLWALAWRVAAISAAIELVQLATRARSVDIDDVLLNTTGGLVGWALFRVVQMLLRRWPFGSRLLARIAADEDRRPLRSALVPAAVSLVLVATWMLWTVTGQTLSDQGVRAQAVEGWTDGVVVARVAIGPDLFVLAGDGAVPGQQRVLTYNRVLPGRYALESISDVVDAEPGVHRTGITTFNVAKRERPTMYVWGANAGAASATVTGNGVELTVTIAGDHFLFGTTFDATLDAVLPPFQLRFFDTAGVDISDRFRDAYA